MRILFRRLRKCCGHKLSGKSYRKYLNGERYLLENFSYRSNGWNTSYIRKLFATLGNMI